MKKALIVAVFWVVCGYFNYGYTLGYFSNRFPEENNINVAIGMAIGGPGATPVVLLASGGSAHWQTKPYTKEQRWDFFHKRWPDIPREEFERDN